MDYELHLAGLEIEITRDCNLNCPHCMRYEPDEPMDAYRGTVIAPEVIDALFDRYRHIELLLLTGGEPMLHPEIITYIVDKIIEKQVYVEQIQVITNGTIASKEAVTALNKAYEYITENCVDWEYPVHIGISTDYHDNQVQYRLYTTSTNNNVSLMSDYIKSIYLMQSNYHLRTLAGLKL